uniref:Uncharacterized protein n=1 Tax=Rhizophora mucronata TaxID=61149 RepID=A0A2P2LQN2_RHIMU
MFNCLLFLPKLPFLQRGFTRIMGTLWFPAMGDLTKCERRYVTWSQ